MARKSKHQPESAAQTLDELESKGDKLAVWISENPAIILGVATAILFVAGIYGFASSRSASGGDESSAALASVQAGYRRAMGASPDDLEVVEPANPETARQVRTEYIGEFQKLSAKYAGTPVAAIASLEAGGLQESLGEHEAAIATLEAAAAAVGSDGVLRALLLGRAAAYHEAGGRWLEAGEAFEQAAAVESYPLRYRALLDAARCFAEAGLTERALDTFARVQAEAPNLRIPPHIQSQLLELRARQAG